MASLDYYSQIPDGVNRNLWLYPHERLETDSRRSYYRFIREIGVCEQNFEKMSFIYCFNKIFTHR